MKDISYHILDIVQNSLNAGASEVEVNITEESGTGYFELQIVDNGCGISENELRQVTDPFFTGSAHKRVGLGLPLLKQNAELTGGTFTIESTEGKGTIVKAIFNSLHIDMIPTGDLAMTFRILIASNPEKDFLYSHRKNNECFVFSTAEIREQLENVSLNTREVLEYITRIIRDNALSP